jgi:hypothetical protein
MDSYGGPRIQYDNYIRLDTLKVINYEKSKPNPNIDAAWKVALAIGILTVLINIIIALIARNTSLKQLKSSKEVLLKQIDSAKENSITNFKGTLNSQNRQKWIDEVRHSISELIAQTSLISVELSSKERNYNTVAIYFEKAMYHKSKVDILLTPLKVEQNEVINLSTELVKICIVQNGKFDIEKYTNARIELIKASRKLSEMQWEKIKNLI